MAQLVIRGNAVRGKEVIETLKMLGGKVSTKLSGGVSSSGYYINSRGNIDYNYWSHFDNAERFTLEEFIARYPYRIGDKVLVKPYVEARQVCEMRWDNNGNYVKYGIGVGEWFNVSQLQPYKEQENMEERSLLATKTETEGYYLITKEQINSGSISITAEESKIMFDKHVTADKVELVLGDDYEVKQDGCKC